jgi:hypothetical protein
VTLRQALALTLTLAAVSCGPPRTKELRTFTDTYSLSVSWEPKPPTARTPIVFKVVVRDKKTGEPIENGEGRMFANNIDGQSTFDSFTPSAESGTYTAKLRFITAGDWAIGIQFRKDSLAKLERPFTDIRMSVHNEAQ